MERKTDMCRVQLDYPTQWLYKVIGNDRVQLRQAIAEILAGTPCEISPSNSSSSGKYHCFNLEITVESEEHRDSIYMALKAHSHVKIVL